MKIDHKNVRQAQRKLRAVAHPLRLKIMEFIDKKGTTPVTPIYRILRLEQSVASQHLKILRDAGVVITKREGQRIIYSVNHNEVKRITDLADRLQGRK